MRVVLTGSSGRVGSAIPRRLGTTHDIIGVDRVPASGTDVVGDVADSALLTNACRGGRAIVHVAALHAPHLGLVSDPEFERANVVAHGPSSTLRAPPALGGSYSRAPLPSTWTRPDSVSA